MKIKVTKTFLKVLVNELAKIEKTKNYYLYIKEFKNDDVYHYFTGAEAWDNEQDRNRAGNMQALAIEYPPEYYACNVYLTTTELNAIAKRANPCTLENFVNAFIDTVEV